MLLKYLFLSFIYANGLANNQINCQELDDFHPIIEDVSFKVMFRVQIFINSEPDSMSEVYEHYQHNLASSNIWQTRSEYVGEARKLTKRFIYEPSRRRDIEFTTIPIKEQEFNEEDYDGPGELYLDENGSSCSYESMIDYKEFRNIDNIQKSIKVLPSSSSLDSILYEFSDELLQVNLDMFMLDYCQELIKSKLHYIRGLSKLFNLIECRRKEFQMDLALTGANYTTRGTKKRVYNSLELKLANTINLIDSFKITLTIQDKLDDYNLASENTQLPAGVIPLSLSLNIIKSGGKRITIIINLFNFKFVDVGEHLSESWSSESNFLLPPANVNLVSLLENIPSIGEASGDNIDSSSKLVKKNNFDQFSFHATLTGSELSSIYKDPIELIIVYDGKARMLARQMTTIDRSVSFLSQWKRQTSRTVYDEKSGLKYHIEHLNDVIDDINRLSSNYASGEEERVFNFNEETWRSCSTNSLSSAEASQLSETNYNKVGDLFNLNDSIFLGMAIIRGIPCYVYEKQLWNLPFWLGFNDYEYALDLSKTKSKILLTFYESVSEFSNNNYQNEIVSRARDEKSSKLVRLIISIVSPLDGKIELEYKLDINSFYYSSNLVLNEEKNLFDIDQECLRSDSNNYHKISTIKHLDIEMSFKSLNDTIIDLNETKFLISLEDDETLRNELISTAIESSFNILEDQQVDLETIIHKSQNNLDLELNLKLTVFDLPDLTFSVDFVCYAEDLSRKLYDEFDNNNWSVGTTRYSIEECKWLASHTLSAKESAHYNSGVEFDSRLFMYCPKTKHCILGDSRWSSVVYKESFEIKSIVRGKFRNADDNNKCLIYSMKLMRRHYYGRMANITDGLPLLNWLTSKKGSSTIRNKTIELKDETLKQGIVMKNTQFKVTNVVRFNDKQQLIRPIQGVGYVRPDNLKPLLVDNISQCSHLCHLNHNCKSYSICKSFQQYKLECLLTKVNWTDTSKIQKLNNFSEQIKGHRKVIKKLNDIQVDYLTQRIDIKLILSPLCSLHSTSHLNIFKYSGTNLIRVPKVEYLIYAQDLNECAKFCIDRAAIIQELTFESGSADNNHNTNFSNTCTSFEYSEEFHFCSLLLPKSVEKLLSIKVKNKIAFKEDVETKINHWYNSYERIKSIENNLMLFSYADIYELNYEQLFSTYTHQQSSILLDKIREDTNSKSRTYLKTPINLCAELCLKWSDCRSFDMFISKQAEHDESFTNCYLHTRSYSDLIVNQTNNKQTLSSNGQLNDVEKNKSNSLYVTDKSSDVIDGNWIHYEPSELISYIMGLSAERRIVKQEDLSIFIDNNYSNSNTVVVVANGALNGSFFSVDDNNNKPIDVINSPNGNEHHHEYSKQNDWSRATESHVHGAFYLWFMVIIVFSMLLVVVYYFVKITNSKRSRAAEAALNSRILENQMGSILMSTVERETQLADC